MPPPEVLSGLHCCRFTSSWVLALVGAVRTRDVGAWFVGSCPRGQFCKRTSFHLARVVLARSFSALTVKNLVPNLLLYFLTPLESCY